MLNEKEKVIFMIYKFIVDKNDNNEPIYKIFTSAKEANVFVQDYYENQDYGIVGVESISEKEIILYCDVV